MRTRAAVVAAAVIVSAGCGSDTDAPGATPTPATSAAAAAGAPVSSGPVYGNPDDAAVHFAEQSYQDCGLMAVATVVGLVTGDYPGEDDMVALASQTASPDGTGMIYRPPIDGDDTTDNGTSPESQQRLLKHYGVPASVTDDDAAAAGGGATGLPALEQYLGAGRRAIASVNAETLWGQDGNHAEADHAVVVIAIDTDQRIVYLSDSGTEGGAGEQVDLDTFESAWQPGKHALVVTDPQA